MFEKITLLIPTRNRHSYLRRILDYYSDTKIGIYVCDSTKTKFRFLKKTKNIKYFHYPDFEYGKKLYFALKNVKTKYVVFCADDDFILPKAIEQCVNFLESHKDYVSAQGEYTYFINKGKNIFHAPLYSFNKNMDINSDIPYERINQMLTNYMQLLYSVCRTQNVRKVFSEVYKNKHIKHINLLEILHTILLCIDGKSKVLPIYYATREYINNSWGTYTDPLEIIAKNKKYKTEYKMWLSILINHLKQKEKISLRKAKQEINVALTIYFDKLSLIAKIGNIKKIKNYLNIMSFGVAKNAYFLLEKIINKIIAHEHTSYSLESEEDYKKITRMIIKYDIRSK